MTRTLLLTLLLALATFARPTEAEAASANTTVTPAPSVMSSFGTALLISGDLLFVGDPVSTHAPGRVLIYRRTDEGWTASAELGSADGSVNDGFGQALAVDGDRLLVGAPGANAAYLFLRDGNGWREAARLTPSGDFEGQFGSEVAIAGETLFGSLSDAPFSFEPGRGGVIAFQLEADGSWSESQRLLPAEIQQGAGFGSALAAEGSFLAVGAPGSNGRAGSLHLFERDADGAWRHSQRLEGAKGRFGAALHLQGERLIIGSPQAAAGQGAVQTARRVDGQWVLGKPLRPSSNDDALFGSALSLSSSDLWVGAPGRAKQTGALYRFERDDDGRWSVAERLVHPAAEAGDRLGTTVSADGATIAVGVPGAYYGAMMSARGEVAIYDATQAEWSGASLEPAKRDVLPPVTGTQTHCAEGKAATFDCKGVDLLSFLPVEEIGGAPGVRVNDIWGWTDPDTDREYAVIGRVDGTAFVDVTDPGNPVYLGQLPMTEGSEAKIWRDVKVYRDHAFIVADNVGDHGMQVFDLTQLRDVDEAARPVTFEATALYEGIESAHNVFINEETGFAYIVGSNGGARTCGGGLHMVDVNDPASPTFAGCFSDPTTGRTGTGSTHDVQCVVYQGPDADYQGREICLSSNETAVSVADVTDKTDPVAITTATHPRTAYIHQGWFSEDQRYFYVNDELDELSGITDRTRTLIWDMSDLDDPQFVREYFLPTPASDHNLYVVGNRMYQANYKSGLRVIDLSNPERPREVAHFDTLPFGEDSPGFEGAFSVYPFFGSGNLIISSIREGLFVVKESEPQL